MVIPRALSDRDWVHVVVKYISPDGRKCCIKRQLVAILERNNICNLSTENFSFAPKPLYNGPPGETVRKALPNRDTPGKRVGKSKIHLST